MQLVLHTGTRPPSSLHIRHLHGGDTAVHLFFRCWRAQNFRRIDIGHVKRRALVLRHAVAQALGLSSSVAVVYALLL